MASKLLKAYEGQGSDMAGLGADDDDGDDDGGDDDED
jgi:hypothetical protein